MAIRKVEFTVTADGIDPASQQFGGVQGEHNATELVFKLSQDFYDLIIEQAEGKTVIYRFDVYDRLGGMVSSDPQALTVQNVVYPLENWITSEGGNIRVHLVISVVEEENTEIDIFSFPALLKLKDKPNGEIITPEYNIVPTMAYNAKVSAARSESAAKVAEDSAASAQTAQQKTEEAMLALEEGSVIIFQGGNAKSRFAIDMVVDGEISDVSSNPVENKVVKNFVEKNLGVGAEAKKAAEENATEIEKLKKETENRDEKIEDLTKNGNLKESKTDGNFYYEKYNNGVAKCWFRVNFEGPIQSSYGLAYYNGSLIYITLPEGLFVEKPFIFSSAIALDAQLYQIAIGSAYATEFSFYVESDRSQEAGKCECCFEFLGKWKEEE